MDLLLLFNLLLGSLLVFPYLSKGETVVLEMPDYAVIGTELKIKCSYSNFEGLVFLSLMENKNERVRVKYKIQDSIDQGKPVYANESPSSGIKFEIEEGSSIKAGAFTFVMANIKCKDFTSYTCQTVSIKSNEKTLQVRPGIGSITPNMMELSVHQVYTFTCRGTVSKEGPFDVQWYRRTITQVNRLIPTQQAQIIGQNNCSRSVQSQLSYNVTESDVPNLILWCKIDGGQSVEAKKNYTVQEMTTIAATPGPQPVKAGLDPGSIVGIVLGIIALIVLIVLVVWFVVIRPKRLKADGSSKEEGPEPNAKDYQEEPKGEVNPALDEKQAYDNAPYTVYPSKKYEVPPPGGHTNPAMEQDIPNHMSGSSV